MPCAHPMRITVTVKPHAKRAGITSLGPQHYQVAVTASPQDGKANAAVIAALAEYFDIPKSRITIVRGGTSRVKVLEIVAS